jgi:hypothetical protein
MINVRIIGRYLQNTFMFDKHMILNLAQDTDTGFRTVHSYSLLLFFDPPPPSVVPTVRSQVA